jgi:UDP-glucose 4-epimerase
VDVYGHPINLPITESTPNKGVTPYALSKIYAESALEDYFPSELTLTLRLPGVYGVSPKSKSVYDSFFRKLKAGIPIEIRNKRVLQLKRDWIYANDLINFIVAVTQDFTPGVFNFVTGNSRSIYDWIQVISMATDLKPIFNILNGSTDEQTFDLVFDASRLYNAFPELTFSAPELSNFASNS